MSNTETTTDSKLLAAIQRNVPLVAQPYTQLARELGDSPEHVMRRVAALRGEGVIREISGIFDAASLGYHQTLAAFAVPGERLTQAGRTVAEHPGVSHCYARRHAVNLWFTLAVSPASALGLDTTIRHLAAACGAQHTLTLPTITRYKLHVHFGDSGGQRGEGVSPSRPAGTLPAAAMEDDYASSSGQSHGTLNAGETPASRKTGVPPRLTEGQVLAIRALQVDLPVQGDPFSPLAELADTTVEGLLEHAADFLRLGVLRRYAAVLHHRQAGGAANVLVAWEAAEGDVDAAGQACATLPQISHCYRRARANEWPFDLYTMIHGPSPAHCLDTVRSIIALTGMQNRRELWTTAEFKKQRVKLLGPEERQWETT